MPNNETKYFKLNILAHGFRIFLFFDAIQIPRQLFLFQIL